MRALIVEDEPIAARLLVRMLGDVAPEIHVAAIVGSLRDAQAWLAVHPAPDAVFLDLHLSDGFGMELLDVLPRAMPVVFTTAYAQYAVQAFERHGVDYLLKPIAPERLHEAVRRLRERMPSSAALHAAEAEMRLQGAHHRTRFLVRAGDAWLPIETTDIACFVRAPAVKLVTMQGIGHLVMPTLDALGTMLDPHDFFRMNRQVLLHRQAVRRVCALAKGRLQVQMQPALPDALSHVSQPRAAAFKAWLGA